MFDVELVDQLDDLPVHLTGRIGRREGTVADLSRALEQRVAHIVPVGGLRPADAPQQAPAVSMDPARVMVKP